MGGCECAALLREEFRKLNEDSTTSHRNVEESSDTISAQAAAATFHPTAHEPVISSPSNAIVLPSRSISTSGSESTAGTPHAGRGRNRYSFSSHSGVGSGTGSATGTASQPMRYIMPVIVACSGYEPATVRSECEKSGITRVEQKPLGSARIRDIIGSCIGELLK